MKENGPWKIVRSEIKYKNPWIEVREDQVIRPDGNGGIYAVVTKQNGVSVLALDDEGYAYLTDEFKYTMGRAYLETVHGGVDEGETPLEAARRELKEELGIIAEEWIDLGLVNPFTEVIYSPVNIFLARKLYFGEQELESGEHIQKRKIKFTEVVRMVMDSEITHGPGSVLILKTKLFMDSEGV